jgi:putative toxin-antitoxin system antitoxin component (TIGR02293 family)
MTNVLSLSKCFSMGVALKKRLVSKPKPKSSARQASIYSYQSVDDKDILSMIDIVRQGISYQEFDKIYRSTPFLLSDWAKFLQISERTIQRNEKERKPFQPVQSERILDIAMLCQYGISVFGDKGNFHVWLNSSSVALGGRIPKELLDTRLGVGMVKDELGRIEHGIFA